MFTFIAIPVFATEGFTKKRTLSADSLAFSDYISIGARYGIADVNNNRLGLIFTAQYSHQILPFLEIETGFFILERYREIKDYYNSYSRVSIGITGDVSIIISPFSSTALAGLRIGGGASLRWRAILASGPLNPPSFKKSEQVYLQELAPGVQAKIEYLIPLDDAVDIGLCGQVHSFFPSVASEDNLTPVLRSQLPSAQMLSLGAFLRINF